MAVSFNSIPVLLRTPGAYTEYDASRALQGGAQLPNRALLIGQMDSSAGTAAENELVQILGKDTGDAAFGIDTQLAHMCKAFKKANPSMEVWAVGLDEESGGSVSSRTLTWTGTATEDGTAHLLFAGLPIDVAISTGDDADAIAAAVDTAVAAKLECLFDSAAGTDPNEHVNTVTSKAKGLWTATLDVRINHFPGQKLPAGVSLAIGSTSGGTTNPDSSTVLDALPDVFYTHIACGWSDSTNTTALDEFATARWAPLVQKDVHSFIAATLAYAGTASAGAALNSKFISLVGPGQSPTPAHTWAAVTCAVDAADPDPARPRQTLELPGCLAPSAAAQFVQSERNLLLYTGVSTVRFDQSGKASIDRLITTYQTNALGSDDPTFLDITTMHTLMALRYTLNARIQTKYGRHKLASDGTIVPPGQPIVTPTTIKSEIIALYTNVWAANGWVEGGALEQFKSELLVERNGSDVNRVDAVLPPDLMNQFIVFAGQIQFLL